MDDFTLGIVIGCLAGTCIGMCLAALLSMAGTDGEDLE